MLKLATIALFIASMIVSGCATQTVNPPQAKSDAPKPPKRKPEIEKEHPILGIWIYTENGCTETYQFLSNGTRKGTSGEEITDAIYTISAEPLSNGFYVLTDKIIRDIGGVGCSGEDLNLTGDITKLFVRFSADQKSLVFCSYKNSKECFGPLLKQEVTFP